MSSTTLFNSDHTLAGHNFDLLTTGALFGFHVLLIFLHFFLKLRPGGMLHSPSYAICQNGRHGKMQMHCSVSLTIVLAHLMIIKCAGTPVNVHIPSWGKF
jgi:hypothetical protein